MYATVYDNSGKKNKARKKIARENIKLVIKKGEFALLTFRFSNQFFTYRLSFLPSNNMATIFFYLRPGFDGTPCTEPNWMGLLLQGTVALDGCACWTLYNLLWLPLSCRLSFLYFLLPSYFFFCCRVSIIFGRKKCSSDPSTQKKSCNFPHQKRSKFTNRVPLRRKLFRFYPGCPTCVPLSPRVRVIKKNGIKNHQKISSAEGNKGQPKKRSEKVT